MQLDSSVQFGVHISIRLSQNIIMWSCKYVLIFSLLKTEGNTSISEEGSQLSNKAPQNFCLSKFPGHGPMSGERQKYL